MNNIVNSGSDLIKHSLEWLNKNIYKKNNIMYHGYIRSLYNDTTNRRCTCNKGNARLFKNKTIGGLKAETIIRLNKIVIKKLLFFL